MYQFSCSAHYVSSEGERSEVVITIKCGDLQIVVRVLLFNSASTYVYVIM